MLAGGAIARVEWASVDTSEIVMLSGRTIATVSVAAPTMCPPEALAGDIYARDIDKLAEVGREDPVAAWMLEEGSSAPNDGRPSVPTRFLCVAEETVMLASSTIGYA